MNLSRLAPGARGGRPPTGSEPPALATPAQRPPRGLAPAACLLALLAVVLGGDASLINLATLVAIWSLWGISFNVVWGYAGQFSMAQVGLGGVSAYSAALLVQDGWSYWPAAAAAIALTMAVGATLSFATLRLAGFPFAIMTLAFVLLFVSALRSSSAVGRSTGIPASSAVGTLNLGFFEWDMSPGGTGFLILVCLATALALLGAWQLLRTRSGRALLAVRGDELLASSLGVRPSHYRLVAFLLSAFLAGVTGVFYGSYLGFLSPDFFGFVPILALIVALVIGGRGRLFGPVVGAAVYYGLQVEFGVSNLVFGIVLIITVLVAPSGLVGLGDKAVAAFGRARRAPGRSGGTGQEPGRVPAALGAGKEQP